MADGNRTPLAAFDLPKIAAALGVSKRAAEMRAKKDGWAYEERAVRGGKQRLYELASLPNDVQAALLLRVPQPAFETPLSAVRPASTRLTEDQVNAAWARYEKLPQSAKAVAARRLRALQAVEALVDQGHALLDARATVAAQMQRDGVRGGSCASLARWASDVARADKAHRLALLVPDYTGRTATAEIPVEAWDLFKGDYLRVEAPSASSCYERLQRIARVRGWELPSLKTFERRVKRELPRGVLILARKGQEAFDKTFPAQERDRSVFQAMEGVNADGHKFDVFVRWYDGRIVRPIMVGVQDLLSGKIVGRRVAETESTDLVRMSFRDAIARYGVPRKAWLDNGRGFASKYLTGGVKNRFRFKVKEEDPVGVLVDMGVEIHWTTPYHGQAKPIERAWRDFCDHVAKHPAFAGAYTGNKPDAKPENYGSKAVPIEKFLQVLDEEIAAHNAREGRRTKVCAGRHSFDQVFNHSYAQAAITKASAEQLRQMLLASEVVTANAQDGAVHLSGNRYWCEALATHAGQKVMLRFDPDALHAAVQVYSLANVFIGQADCVAAVGFADTDAAREHARAKKQFRRAARQQLDAERRMDAAKVAAQLPEPAPESLPPAGVIAPIFGKRPAPKPEAVPLQRTGTDDSHEYALRDVLARMQADQIAASGWEPEDL